MFSRFLNPFLTYSHLIFILLSFFLLFLTRLLRYHADGNDVVNQQTNFIFHDNELVVNFLFFSKLSFSLWNSLLIGKLVKIARQRNENSSWTSRFEYFFDSIYNTIKKKRKKIYKFDWIGHNPIAGNTRVRMKNKFNSIIFITVITRQIERNEINNVPSKHGSGIVSPIVCRFSRQIEHVIRAWHCGWQHRPCRYPFSREETNDSTDSIRLDSLYTGCSWKEKRRNAGWVTKIDEKSSIN